MRQCRVLFIVMLFSVAFCINIDNAVYCIAIYGTYVFMFFKIYTDYFRFNTRMLKDFDQ